METIFVPLALLAGGLLQFKLAPTRSSANC